MAENTDVVVIGGGYAGVMAANQLTQRDVTVTLINPRLRLRQLAGGSHDAVVDHREILAEGARLVVDNVTRIDAAGRKVERGTVGCDYLIYAVGSGSASLRVPGAAEFAHKVATPEAARRLRSVLDTTPALSRMWVVVHGELRDQDLPRGRRRASSAAPGAPVRCVHWVAVLMWMPSSLLSTTAGICAARSSKAVLRAGRARIPCSWSLSMRWLGESGSPGALPGNSHG